MPIDQGIVALPRVRVLMRCADLAPCAHRHGDVRNRAEVKWRWALKAFLTATWAERNFCAEPALLKGIASSALAGGSTDASFRPDCPSIGRADDFTDR
jgi:hypothetical protein